MLKIKVLTVSIIVFLQTACSPNPMQCDDSEIKSSIIKQMNAGILKSRRSEVKNYFIKGKIPEFRVEKITTLKRNDENPYYRLCEISFKIGEFIDDGSFQIEHVGSFQIKIDRGEDGDIYFKSVAGSIVFGSLNLGE